MGSTNAPPVLPAGVTWTFATLPTSGIAVGQTAYTSDSGTCTWNGTSWIATAAALTKKPPFIPPGLANVQRVMTSPPTIAISTTNPLAGGLFYAATNNSGTPAAQYVDLSAFGVCGAGNPIVSGPNSPDPNYVAWMSVSAGTGAGIGTYNGANMVNIRVNFQSPAATPIIVLQCKGLTGQIFAKVNDQFVSLTPTAIPNNGSANYVSLTFAAPITGMVTIEFLADDVLNSFRFGGMWTATGDTLTPAQIRGPQQPVIIMGDSFTTGTGAGGMALGLVQVFKDYLGWDNVMASGIGGTGLINPGAAVTYLTRLANDVYPFNPSELIIQGFFNDASQTGAAVQAALSAVISAVLANLPNCKITVIGPYIVNGSGYQSGTIGGTGVVAQRTALAAAVTAANSALVRYIDPTSFNPVLTTPQTVALTNSPAGGATTFTYAQGANNNISPGQTFQFPDGSRCYVLSASGNTVTVDKIQNAQTSGTIITAVPGCYLRGNGRVGATTGVGNADTLVYTDAIHPSPQGHIVLGTLFAQAYAAGMTA